MRTPVLRQTSVLGSLLMTILMLSVAPELVAQASLVVKDSVYIDQVEGVVILPDGGFYATELTTDKIKKYDASGAFVSEFGGAGTTDGLFNSPTGIAIDSQGNIFVVDRSNDRVQKFNSSGTFIKVIGTTTASNADGDFDNPTDIAIDAADNVYVVDRGNDRVQKLTNDGVFIKNIGSNGTGDGEFSAPYGIALDNDANLYITDTSNDNVQKFDSTGVFISKFGTIGSGDGELTNPAGIALDSEGNIYVTDTDNANIQVFNSSFTFIHKIAPHRPLDLPIFMALNANDELFVSDKALDYLYIYTPAQEINLLQGSTEIASASTVDFGEVGVGTTSTLAFTIENLGGIDLEFSGTTGSQVVLSGDHAADFSVTQTEVLDSLEGFSSVSFTVTYTPATLGSNSATLTINSNDEDEGTYTIDLTAMAVDITAPAFTSAATVSIEENAAGVAYTVATDDATATITLGTSKDESLFTLANGNEISFTASPDFEDPKDGDANNDYVIDVIAEDESGNSATLEVTITVTDANDNPLSVFNENKIGIYPNPAVEVVSIADASVKYAVVYNLMGAKVYAAELENGTLNVKSLRKGLYVLTLMDGVGNILSTNRLMKE